MGEGSRYLIGADGLQGTWHGLPLDWPPHICLCVYTLLTVCIFFFNL